VISSFHSVRLRVLEVVVVVKHVVAFVIEVDNNVLFGILAIPVV
jgi:hypothetical protein